MTVTRARRRLVVIVGLVLWGFGTHGTYAGSGDEPRYAAIAHSTFWQNPELLWNDGDGRAAFCSRVGSATCEALPSFPLSVR